MTAISRSSNCAFAGPDMQDMYFANLRGDPFSHVRTTFRGHPLSHQR